LNSERGAFHPTTAAPRYTAVRSSIACGTLGLAVTKGQHADLLKRMNDGLAAIRADGTLQRIEDKWNGR
jgi:ABC-type amino acid transport substrate-binding protein